MAASRAARLLARALLGIALVLALGCGCKSAWRDCGADGPLIGPGTAAKSMKREVRSLSLYMTANGHAEEVVWAGCGRRVYVDDVRREIEAYLTRSRFYGDLKDTTGVEFTSSSGARLPQKVAPYKLCVVSLCPTVVILVPYDYGYVAATRSISRVGDPAEWGGTIGLVPLAGYLHAGTNFPYAEGLLWFKPGDRVEPRPVHRVDAAADEVKDDGVHLVLAREQKRFRVTRRR